MIFFFFGDTATIKIYTLSLHDALPIFTLSGVAGLSAVSSTTCCRTDGGRSEEHTSELQSRLHLVCRLLLEKKKERKTERCSTPPREYDQSWAGCCERRDGY